MWYQTLTATALLGSTAFAAPAVVKRDDSSDATVKAVVAPTNVATGPPGASGSLRGSKSLIGYDSSYPSPDAEATEDNPSNIEYGVNQKADPELGLYIDISDVDDPQPIAGNRDGPLDAGPRDKLLEKQNPSLYIPPNSDSGDIPNAKWPMGLSHNRHGIGNSGFARQQNTDNLPIAKGMAGVDMALGPNAYRELHWHKANEWAYIMNGTTRLNAVNEAGETFVDDLGAGDVWFFPAGVPHSIQAGDEGVEFLLVFDDGAFSEDETFLVSELFERNPKSVLAKNFRTDTSAFDKIPKGELYIFDGTPFPNNTAESNITGPAGPIPQTMTYSYHFSQQEAYEVPGGSVKILDPQTFPIASNFASALFTVKPGAMRELHWHTTSDEWTFIVKGNARLTVYQAPEASRTFDFQAGDVGYVPVPNAHYIENTGDEDLVYLEVLQAPTYNDISVAQWLGLTPKQIVKDHLGLSEQTLDRLPHIKPYILPGDPDLSKTNFTEESL